MKNVLLTIMILLVINACNQPSDKTKTGESTSGKSVLISDNSVVNIYYFHGKQRCKTCIAVGNVVRETVEKKFQGNDKVKFIELNTDDEVNNTLVEKYDVSWNALIISKGEKYKDITDDAFATAVGNPEKLSGNIISIVESMLSEK